MIARYMKQFTGINEQEMAFVWTGNRPRGRSKQVPKLNGNRLKIQSKTPRPTCGIRRGESECMRRRGRAGKRGERKERKVNVRVGERRKGEER